MAFVHLSIASGNVECKQMEDRQNEGQHNTQTDWQIDRPRTQPHENRSKSAKIRNMTKAPAIYTTAGAFDYPKIPILLSLQSWP